MHSSGASSIPSQRGQNRRCNNPYAPSGPLLAQVPTLALPLSDMPRVLPTTGPAQGVTPPMLSFTPGQLPHSSNTSLSSSVSIGTLSNSCFLAPSEPQPTLPFVALLKHHHRHTTALCHMPYAESTYVIVDGDGGIDLAQVTAVFPAMEFQQRVLPFLDKRFPKGFPVARVQGCATSSQLHEWAVQLPLLNQQALRALHTIQRQCSEYNRVEYVAADFQFDRRKLYVFYKSNMAVEYNAMVGALFQMYRCRIWTTHIDYDDAPALTTTKPEQRPRTSNYSLPYSPSIS